MNLFITFITLSVNVSYSFIAIIDKKFHLTFSTNAFSQNNENKLNKYLPILVNECNLVKLKLNTIGIFISKKKFALKSFKK